MAIKLKKKKNIVKGARKVRDRGEDPSSRIAGAELRGGHVIRGGKGESGQIIGAGKVKSGSSQKYGHTIRKKNIVVDARKSGDAVTKKDKDRLRRLLKKKGRLVSRY